MKRLKNPLVEIGLICGLSILIHLFFFGGIEALNLGENREKQETVKIEIKQTPKEEEPEASPEPPPPPKKIEERKPKLPEQREPKKKPQENAKKIQGTTVESLTESDEAKIAVPVGNTLMDEDKGIRLSPDEIAALKKDLSADAILIQGSFIAPEYTQPALDANLEGSFIVDVFVDTKGKVTAAELRKKIGYGMDERVLGVAKSAKFIPRKDAKGVPLAGWAEIKFYLEIP